MTFPYKPDSQNGFTLLELMVVVAVMAVVSATVVLSSSSSQEYSEDMAVRTEMEQLRQAVVRFFRDQNSYAAASPADIAFLFEPGTNDSWDPDYRTGWRGPYIKGGDLSYRTPCVSIGDGLKLDGDGDPENGNIGRVIANPDPFAYPASGNVFIWTLREGSICNSNPEIERLGRPYYFFDLNTYNSAFSIARIVSSGPNGVYGDGDDLVLMIKGD